MRELRYQLIFEGKAAPDDAMGESMSLEARAGFPPGLDSVFTTGVPEAVMTSRIENDEDGESFRESGEILFGGGTLRFETQGYGRIGPSALPDRQCGVVTWRVTGGSGAFEDASGFIQSVFTVSEDATVVDSQSAVLFTS